MKVKELKAKYPNYHVITMGYPNCIPFTCLPDCLKGLTGKAYEKVENELEVKGYKAIHNPHECISIGHLILGGKKKPNSKYDGTLEIYLKGNNPL